MTEIKWKPQWSEEDIVIWINVEKLDHNWIGDNCYIRPRCFDPRDKTNRYYRFGIWLNENIRTNEVCMPHIALKEDTVSFTDGRHRFAWCRDNGVRHLPVTVSLGEQAETIEAQFGTPVRLSFLP